MSLRPAGGEAAEEAAYAEYAARAEQVDQAEPRRVTLELPAVGAPPEPAEPAEPAAPDAPAEPPRRVTRELPLPPPTSLDEQMMRILRAPQASGETVEGAFSRKERELLAVFEPLAPTEASELFRRLTTPRPGDPVAASFGRMVPERRGRLLAFLLGAPRRAAIARARRHASPMPRPQPRSEARPPTRSPRRKHE